MGDIQAIPQPGFWGVLSGRRASPPGSLPSGNRSTPARLAMVAAVRRLSPAIMMARSPIRRSRAIRTSMFGLSVSYSTTTPSARLPSATKSGVERSTAGSSARAIVRSRPANLCTLYGAGVGFVSKTDPLIAPLRVRRTGRAIEIGLWLCWNSQDADPRAYRTHNERRTALLAPVYNRPRGDRGRGRQDDPDPDADRSRHRGTAIRPRCGLCRLALSVWPL